MDQLPLTHPQLVTWPTTQACALIRNQTHDLSVHKLALSPLCHTSQGLKSFHTVNEPVYPQPRAGTTT